MLVALGSKNPVKVNATRYAFEKAFGAAIELTPVENVYESVSQVAHTPRSMEETRRGAENRARLALKAVKGADYGVGIEGGVQETKDGLMLCGCVVVVDNGGMLGVGGGTELLMPAAVGRRIKAGEELGDIIDDVTGDKDTKKKGGSLGWLTKGHVNREDYFRMITLFALAPFISKELYGKV